MASDWSEFEVDAVVTDYFAMLLSELRGEAYSKAAHRHVLTKLLDERSDSSIEFKHQNISAVLIDLGYPYIVGYKRMENYQRLLAAAVLARIVNNREIEPAVAASVEEAAQPATVGDILSRIAEPPSPPEKSRQCAESPLPGASVGRTVNYLEREARNRSLGRMGEEFAVAFEKARLVAAGSPRLAPTGRARVGHAGGRARLRRSSFEAGGEDRLIEAKTTAFARRRRSS